MKTKVLKTVALCAMMLVPIGAAADDVVVTTETTWQFDGQEITEKPCTLTVVTAAKDASGNKTGLYYRAGADGRAIRVVESSSYSYTFSDGTVLSTSSSNGIAALPTNSAIAPVASLTASNKEGEALTKSDNSDGDNRTLAFTTGKAGRVYVIFQGGTKVSDMKDETTYSFDLWFKGSSAASYSIAAQLTLDKNATNGNYDDSSRRGHIFYEATEGGTFVLGSKTGTMNVYAIKFVPADDDQISNTTVWTFDQYQYNETVAGSTSALNYGGLFIKGHNDDSNMASVSWGTGTYTFGDKEVVSHTSLYQKGGSTTNAAALKYNASNVGVDCAAFNAAVPGTVYVQMKTNSNDRASYLYFNGEQVATRSTSETPGTSHILTYTSTTAGVFCITAASAHNIYAIKFVPTSETAANKTITMSDMGVMTFSSTMAWTLPSGLKAYLVKGPKAKTDGSKFNVVEVTGAIPACTGVILQGTHNQEYTLTSTDVSVNNSDVDWNQCLRPVIADYTLAGQNDNATANYARYNYILAKQDESMVLARSSGRGTLLAGKAYYSIRQNLIDDSGSSARYFTLDFGGESTGINSVENGQLVIDNVVYNLSGQRVDSNYKGIVIKNGKKVIIK